MMVSHKHRAIFLHVPKCGGTTLTRELDKLGFEKMHLQVPDGTDDDATGAYRLGVARRARRIVAPEVWHSYLKFSFVRNPFSRLVSCWNHKFPYLTFRDFCKRYDPAEHHTEWDFVTHDGWRADPMWHALPMAHHLCDDDGSLLCDFVGRVETYEQDAKRLADLLGCPPLHVSEKTALNVREKKTPWQHEYDEATRAVVHSKFHADFVLFGYASTIDGMPKVAAPPTAPPRTPTPPFPSKDFFKLMLWRYVLKPYLHHRNRVRMLWRYLARGTLKLTSEEA